MLLNFLGFGSGYSPVYGNTNAWFTQGNSFYLIDSGFTAFEKVKELREFREAGRLTVIVTHLHADHCGSLPMLLSYSGNILKKKVSLIFPEDTIISFLRLTGIEDSEYNLYKSLPDSVDSAVQAEPVPVEHTHLINCYGYLIRINGHRLYYSGDAHVIPEKVLSMFYKEEIETMYIDTTYIEGNSESHGSLEYYNTLFNRAQRDKIVCMHFDTNFSDTVKENGYKSAADFMTDTQES